MRRIDIEAWAYRTIDAVVASGTVEDTYVELKAEWPSEFPRTARQLAALANAARGEPVLWLVGVDEKQRLVLGAPESELSAWWNQVASEFEGPTPALQSVVVHPSQGPPVMALVFDTEARPFVVKNPDGGRIAFEIPWREGNATRTARRAELVQMLAPAATLPTVDVLWMQLTASLRGTSEMSWRLDSGLYFYSDTETTLVIPHHRCHATVEVPEYRMHPTLEMSGFSDQVGSPLVSATGNELILRGPGMVEMMMYRSFPHSNLWSKSPALKPDEDVQVLVELFVPQVQAPILIEQTLFNASAESASWGLWKYQSEEGS